MDVVIDMGFVYCSHPLALKRRSKLKLRANDPAVCHPVLYP